MKIGILSPFYKNYNYGGKLQAYALVEILKKKGYQSEQIQYEGHSIKRKKSLCKKIIQIKDSNSRHVIYEKILGKILRNLYPKMSLRKTSFNDFDEKICHSKTVYTDENIQNANHEYDIFICGSDQIWNPSLLKKAYLLEFTDKYKFSYAASISNEIDDLSKELFQNALISFDAISVREKQSSESIRNLINKKIELVADPTLLLDRNDWDEICSNKQYPEPYIFCYFLGYGKKMRKNATKLAKSLNMPIKTFPHLLGIQKRFYWNDLNFGDEPIYDAGPEEFINLIKHADYVLTDSFHATVISLIYQKQFITFSRIGYSKMSSRINDLLNLFDLNNHHLPFDIEYKKLYEVLKDKIMYQSNYPKLDNLIVFSKNYLIQNIEKAMEKTR
ncbi:MAG: polysaccharide pyruvyl transferase family protein [Traorella sp.]